MNEQTIIRSDIIKYGYYDESQKYIVVLNKDKLKEIFNADIIKFEEDE